MDIPAAKAIASVALCGAAGAAEVSSQLGGLAIHVQEFVASAVGALRDNEDERLCRAFDTLVATPNPEHALVSRALVEGFLAATHKTEHARRIHAAMRDSRFRQYAVPLMLAYQAHLENKEYMIVELAPELVRATQIMYRRLAWAGI